MDIIKTFSKHLFWDVAKDNIDILKNKKYIINSVIQYGFFTDWEIIVKLYTTAEIAKVAIQNKSLDKKTATFIALASNTPTSKFSCFSIKQSIPRHWNF